MSAALTLRTCAGAVLVAIGLAACTTTPDEASAVREKPAPPVAAKPAPPPPPSKPKPPSPPKEAEATPAPSPNVAVEAFRKGVQAYDDGNYRDAAKLFAGALDLGLSSPADRATAHKHLAFIACVDRRIAACRTEFRKAFEADPAFDLSAAEAGHPTWGPLFRSVKAERQKKRANPPPTKAPSPAG